MSTSRRRKGIRIALAVFWLVAMGWVFLNMQARDVDPSVLTSGLAISVSTSAEAIVFTPAIDTAAVGLLFYPGAAKKPASGHGLSGGIPKAEPWRPPSHGTMIPTSLACF